MYLSPLPTYCVGRGRDGGKPEQQLVHVLAGGVATCSINSRTSRYQHARLIQCFTLLAGHWAMCTWERCRRPVGLSGWFSACKHFSQRVVSPHALLLHVYPRQCGPPEWWHPQACSPESVVGATLRGFWYTCAVSICINHVCFPWGGMAE